MENENFRYFADYMIGGVLTFEPILEILC